MFVCTRAKSSPRASSKVPGYLVLRPLFLTSIATLVLTTTIGCQKPKGVDFATSGLVIGRVIDASSRTPIGGATLEETPAHRAVTGPEGNFQLPLPIGSTTIVVNAAGYHLVSLPVEVTAGKTIFATKDGYVRLTPVMP
jgi:hypothetical protein